MPSLSIVTTAGSIDRLEYESQAIAAAAPENGFDTVYLVNPMFMTYGLVRGERRARMVYCGQQFHTDALVIRATGGLEPAIALLARAVRNNGGVLVDPVSRHTTGKASKLVTTFTRWQDGSGITTYFSFSRDGMIDIIRMLDENRQWPVIVKPWDGSHGNGVYQIDSAHQLMSYGSSVFSNTGLRGSTNIAMVQPKIDIVNEWRVVVIDGAYIGMAKKTAAEGQIAANVARGGVLTADHRDDVVQFVLDSVSDEGLLGVDVVEDENGLLYVMEANRAPGAWEAFLGATGVNVAHELVRSMANRLFDERELAL